MGSHQIKFNSKLWLIMMMMMLHLVLMCSFRLSVVITMMVSATNIAIWQSCYVQGIKIVSEVNNAYKYLKYFQILSHGPKFICIFTSAIRYESPISSWYGYSIDSYSLSYARVGYTHYGCTCF